VSHAQVHARPRQSGFEQLAEALGVEAVLLRDEGSFDQVRVEQLRQ